MNYNEIRYNKAGPAIAAAFEARGFVARYCETAEQARDAVLDLVPPDDTVSFGGAMSMEQIGAITALAARGNPIIDRASAKNAEDKARIMRSALLCDTFLMGANALSADGQMVNIDGNGNRVAALCYGPKSVIVVAGMNKVCPTLADAMVRARSIAAPTNSQRFQSETRPCYLTGRCIDCKAPDTICAQIVTTRYCRPQGRIKLILVGCDLGM